MTVSNTGTPFDRLARLARRDAADHLRAVFEAALGMKLADLAGDALADDARVFVDQNAHGVELVGAKISVRSQLTT